MNISMLTDFFMWCSIVNFGLLILSFLMITLGGNLIYKLHGKMFPMPRETFNVVLYSFMGFYKILVFVLNVIPWIVLEIIA